MAKGATLGEFEQHVLMTLIGKEDAYGMSIRRELEEETSRSVSIGAVYATLERLEQKGFVESWLGEPIPERGGRARRHFRINGVGISALKTSTATLARRWMQKRVLLGVRP